VPLGSENNRRVSHADRFQAITTTSWPAVTPGWCWVRPWSNPGFSRAVDWL